MRLSTYCTFSKTNVTYDCFVWKPTPSECAFAFIGREQGKNVFVWAVVKKIFSFQQ